MNNPFAISVALLLTKGMSQHHLEKQQITVRINFIPESSSSRHFTVSY
jgi:hypothetical protein